MDKTIPFKLERRDRAGHKGDYGRVLVVGGSVGMIGAPALASTGALRGGAGLVTMALPEEIQLATAPLCPCATTVSLDTSGGQITASALATLGRHIDNCDIIVAGPGMSTGADRQQIIRYLLQQDKPLVIDADGLNNLSSVESWPSKRKCPIILTPHPGEFSRLFPQYDRDRSAEQGYRREVAITAATDWLAECPDHPLVLVLKGEGTVVTDSVRTFVNPTGNPGMATGGSGDLLAGLLAAILCQCADPYEGSAMAVWLHGMAGDLAAEEMTEQSMIASDLADYLPKAMKYAISDTVPDQE